MAKGDGPSRGRRAADRGRYGKLSRERVLAAALELVDREGLSALSMRRVGAELGVEAMALYRYAPSKDALLDGLVEALYLELQDFLANGGAQATPQGDAAEGPEWRAELHRMPVQELPRLREAAPALAEHGGPQGLAAGLDALLGRFTQEAR